MRVLLLVADVLFRLLIETCMFDKSLNSFVDLLELLLVLDTGLFQRGSDGWSLGMSVLICLILHFDRYVSFLEVRLGCIV